MKIIRLKKVVLDIKAEGDTCRLCGHTSTKDENRTFDYRKTFRDWLKSQPWMQSHPVKDGESIKLAMKVQNILDDEAEYQIVDGDAADYLAALAEIVVFSPAAPLPVLIEAGEFKEYFEKVKKAKDEKLEKLQKELEKLTGGK